MIREGTIYDINAGEDGTERIVIRLSKEDAEAVLDGMTKGSVVRVGINPIEEPDDATSCIRHTILQMSKRTGQSTNEIRHKLLTRAGAPLRTGRKKTYIITADEQLLNESRTLYTRKSKKAKVKPGWICGELIKNVNEHTGEELRLIFKELNTMLEAAGMKPLSDRVIEMYINKQKDKEGGGQ